MYESVVKIIIDYIKAKHNLFFIRHTDYFAVRDILKSLYDFNTVKKSYSFLEFTNAFGGKNIFDLDYDLNSCAGDLLSWLSLRNEDFYEEIIILKDISNYYQNAEVISAIKQITEMGMQDVSKIIFIFDSSNNPFPKELESLITIIDIKPLQESEICEVINDYCTKNDIIHDFMGIEEHAKRFANSFKGLQKFQIEQILNTAVTKSKKNHQGKKELSISDDKTILAEKKQLIKKSGILEIIDKPGKIEDIGGLKNLKEWLIKKSKIYGDIYTAQSHGVSVPRGILIVGMPGCGKSLTAKATASAFNVALVRLDVGSLLGKYVGESEANMKQALALSEAFAPCVLWIDELEKAFAGIQGGGDGNEIVTRLFGQFLTWMQEKESPVFIVATANSISSLPPEFLRKGRFDELFKVELPNEKEREDIIRLKLEAKDKNLSMDNIKELAKVSKGFNGGDIEAVINQAIENRYIEWLEKKTTEAEQLTFEDVNKVFKDPNTKSVSETLKDKIDSLQDELKKYSFRNASAE